MPGPIQRGSAFVERILSDGVETVNTKKVSIDGDEDIILRIPTDYSTLDEALTAASQFVPARQFEIVIVVESGHEITDPVYLTETDLRGVRLTAEDDTVAVSTNFPDGENIIEIDRAVGPVFDCKIDAQGNGNNGIYLNPTATYMSVADPSVGLINAGRNGITAVNGSIAGAYENDFSGAGRDAAFCGRASMITLGGGVGPNLSNAGRHAIYSERGALVRTTDADCSGSGSHSIVSRKGATVSADRAVVPNSGGMGLRAAEGGNIVAVDAEVESAASIGVFATDDGHIVAPDTIVKDSGSSGVQANQGQINIFGGEVTGSDGDDINIVRGNRINIHDCVTSSSTGGNPHLDDLSQTPNELTSDGFLLGSFES